MYIYHVIDVMTNKMEQPVALCNNQKRTYKPYQIIVEYWLIMNYLLYHVIYIQLLHFGYMIITYQLQAVRVLSSFSTKSVSKIFVTRSRG